MKLKELEIIETGQDLYDSFNNFILSSDTKVFGKLLARILLLDRVKSVPGDIVECGVFKGTGLLTFLKAKRFLCPNSGKKVIGFDFFDSEELIKSLSGLDQEAMKTLFDKRNTKHDKNFVNYLSEFIQKSGFDNHEFDLVAGDITKSAADYISDKPGLRISLLYIDLDVDEPTFETLNALWDRVVKGGIVVFDEYAFHKWSESKAVDRFFAGKNAEIKSLDFICPTAYIEKTDF